MHTSLLLFTEVGTSGIHKLMSKAPSGPTLPSLNATFPSQSRFLNFCYEDQAYLQVLPGLAGTRGCAAVEVGQSPPWISLSQQMSLDAKADCGRT